MPILFKRRIANRNQHMIFFTSMVILFLTGYVRRIPDSWIDYFGPVAIWTMDISTSLHRLAAIAFIVSSFYHLKFLFFTPDGRDVFKNLLFTKQDLIDFYIHVASSFHLTKKKLIKKRFYYNEKCDYWITFQGTLVFIITGVILWIEEYFGKFTIDVSYILHTKEALWGIYAIMIWHFFNLHPEFYLYAREDAQPCGRDECVVCGICDLLGEDKSNLDIFLKGEKGAHLESMTTQHSLILCIGDTSDRVSKLKEENITSCKSGKAILSKFNVCQYGCLGLGDCAVICPPKAITVNEKGSIIVDNSICIGCGNCVKECPQKIITLYPKEKHVHIPCSSFDKGVRVRELCEVGCLGCGICVKFCPTMAITMENNLAKIDYSKCIECGVCAAKCPHKTIVDCIGRTRRGYVAINKSLCNSCGECTKVCPLKAIQPDEGKFKVEKEKCIGCKICIEKCPTKAIAISL